MSRWPLVAMMWGEGDVALVEWPMIESQISALWRSKRVARGTHWL